MEPIVLIHGYSAESKETDLDSISGIYGSLPKALRDAYGGKAVVEIDLSRYISLEDGLSVDDISRALDRVLHGDEFSHLLAGNFHVVIHSTGALVIRNWIRTFSPRPSPLRNLIYLAGANLGSGWAHIGKGQLAKWSRQIFQGSERGVQVLDALELGSEWAIELHCHFLAAENRMPENYGVREYVVVGTQADPGWFSAPIRYAKEDGSDGVVRVAASNLNFQYLRFAPNDRAYALTWEEVEAEVDKHVEGDRRMKTLYEIAERSSPGQDGRAEIPFAIPFQCAHSGEDMGIVTGSKPRKQVLQLIKQALETTTTEGWSGMVQAFADETAGTYQSAAGLKVPAKWEIWLDSPQAQYDSHAQVVWRLRDQDGRPIEHFDIYFESFKSSRDDSIPFGSLIQDKHVNVKSPNVITFYVRTKVWDGKKKRWIEQMPKVEGVTLEITAVEPRTDDIKYVPMRFSFTAEQLTQWIVGNRTTVIDITLLRVPSPKVYMLKRLPA